MALSNALGCCIRWILCVESLSDLSSSLSWLYALPSLPKIVQRQRIVGNWLFIGLWGVRLILQIGVDVLYLILSYVLPSFLSTPAPALENLNQCTTAMPVYWSYFIQRWKMMLKTGREVMCHPSSCHFCSLKMDCEDMRSGMGRRINALPALMKALDSWR